MHTLENQVLLSNTSPTFLHANSTSHTWIFSAFAELIDNAYDPDAGATILKIDVETIEKTTCLTFTDNGKGMSTDKLHKMLSFGFCEKTEIGGHKPIGQYGNGFKSGSMRLGQDALIITKDSKSISVGLLSQTYLAAIKSETVLVPIITMDKNIKTLQMSVANSHSCVDILKYSILSSKELLMKEIFHLNLYETGTRIIIYNLKKGRDNMHELDFQSNEEDILNSEHHEFDEYSMSRMAREYVPEYRRSLHAYCSILFLKPRMKIFVRNKKVKTKLISRSLRQSEVDFYKPKFLEKPVKIVFGFGDSRDDCGMMLYNRKRLIKAYEKVGPQKQNSGLALGIVGVIEVDFLEPIHNKQDFNKTDRYNACIYSLGVKLNDYWQEKTQATEIDVERISESWNWVQCDNSTCLKWRRLPYGADKLLPEKWFCYMNRDPTHNRCDIDEEPEDEDALLKKKATYKKTIKKKKSANDEKQLNRQQLEEEVRLSKNLVFKIKEENEKQTEQSQMKVHLLEKELREAIQKQQEQTHLINMLAAKSAAVETIPLNSGATTASYPQANGLLANETSNNNDDFSRRVFQDHLVITPIEMISDDQLVIDCVESQSNSSALRETSNGCNFERIMAEQIPNGNVVTSDAETEDLSNDGDCNVEDDCLDISKTVSKNKPAKKTADKRLIPNKRQIPNIKRKRKSITDVIVIDSADDITEDELIDDSIIKHESDVNDSFESNEVRNELDSADKTNTDNDNSTSRPLHSKLSKLKVVFKNKKPNRSKFNGSNTEDSNRGEGELESISDAADDCPMVVGDKDQRTELTVVTQQLHELRKNVARLLRCMLPDMENIQTMKIDEVDQMLVGVLKANETG